MVGCVSIATPVRVTLTTAVAEDVEPCEGHSRIAGSQQGARTMRRLTALLLVASLSIQAAGCTSSAPARPDLAASRGASSAAADVSTRRSATEAATTTSYPSASR